MFRLVYLICIPANLPTSDVRELLMNDTRPVRKASIATFASERMSKAKIFPPCKMTVRTATNAIKPADTSADFIFIIVIVLLPEGLSIILLF